MIRAGSCTSDVVACLENNKLDKSFIIKSILAQASRELNGTVTDSQEIKVDNTRKRKSSEIQPEIEQENQKLKEAQTCKICLVKEIRVVFLPCGHLMSCVNCTRKLKKCAVCRQFIHKKQKTYRS